MHLQTQMFFLIMVRDGSHLDFVESNTSNYSAQYIKNMPDGIFVYTLVKADPTAKEQVPVAVLFENSTVPIHLLQRYDVSEIDISAYSRLFGKPLYQKRPTKAHLLEDFIDLAEAGADKYMKRYFPKLYEKNPDIGVFRCFPFGFTKQGFYEYVEFEYRELFFGEKTDMNATDFIMSLDCILPEEKQDFIKFLKYRLGIRLKYYFIEAEMVKKMLGEA